VGICAFKGMPNASGQAEIGYSVLPELHARGYATEAVRALVSWALGHPFVTEVVANTYSHLLASITVLERNGFQSVGAPDSSGQVQYALPRAAHESA
jgi:RimJ/RimL family protein N-acetyltransferase